MTHTFQDFIKYEQNEIHRNIDRLEHGLQGEDPANPKLSGQYKVMALQEAHLNFVEELGKRAKSYDDAIQLCREQIIQNEMSHMHVSFVENHQVAMHSSEWWYTLQQIQFYSDFMNRIKSWRKAYA